MLKEYTTQYPLLIENSKRNLSFNINELNNLETIVLNTKNNAFNFELYKANNFTLPDGYYTKPYPTANIYNYGTAPTTPYLISYKTNIYNYLNSYSLTLLNNDQTINTVYYGDLLYYNNVNYLIYGFTINYQNSIENDTITTISASGFSLNPNGNKYNTISYDIANYNPLFFINTNNQNEYYYYNSDKGEQILASPYVNTDYPLGSYELNTNFAYFKNYNTGNNTIEFNTTPVINANDNLSNNFNFSTLTNYYVGNTETPTFKYKYGFIACNYSDTTNTGYGTAYAYNYNYESILRSQSFTTNSDIKLWQNYKQYINNEVYYNTTNNVEINDNNYIYDTQSPNFKPIELYNKLVSTNNIELTLHTIDLRTFTKDTVLNTNDIFTNMQTINISGITIGAVLSAVLTFTVIVSLLKLGR